MKLRPRRRRVLLERCLANANAAKLERDGYITVECEAINVDKTWRYGIADTNVSGRVQVSLAVPTHIIRKIIAPHTSVIREYLELKHYCHILAVHGIKSSVPRKQGLHRDYMHARKVLVLAVATHDCPISTQFVPRSHRGLEDRGVTSDCTRTDQAVLYDASVLHCGSAEISPYRVFIFIAKLNDDDDFVSLATECSEYNPRFSFYPVPIFFDESGQTCP